LLVVVLVTLSFIAAAVASAVMVMAWRRRHEAPGFTATALLAAATAHWSLTDAALLLVQEPSFFYVLVVMSFPSSCLLAAAWWCLSHTFTDRAWRLSRRSTVLLAIEPLLCLGVAATDWWHGLFIVRIQVTDLDGVLAPVFGPAFWLHSTYTFALLAIALIRVVRRWAVTSSRYQGHLFALASSLPALLFNVVGLSSNGRLPDLTALGFAITSPLHYWMVSRLSLLVVAPVAHQRVFEKISDIILVIDRQFRILDLNPAAERLLRVAVHDPPAYFVGADLNTVLAQARRPFPVPPMFTPGQPESERTIVDAGGSGVDLSIRVSALQDRRQRLIGWVLVARDVTEQLHQQREPERANERLQDQVATIEALRADLSEQAARDPITGLYNRRRLDTELAAAVSQAQQQGAALSVVVLDIDFFKNVNDRYGHAAGDAVLVEVSTVLRENIGAPGLVARHGGEEFVVVLPGVAAPAAVTRVDALRQLVGSRPMVMGGDEVRITFSAGVAALAGVASPEELVSSADQALYAAKKNGRDQVRLASEPVLRLAPA
jgi:diguanylate cyclase (GGDEF)-like protein